NFILQEMKSIGENSRIKALIIDDEADVCFLLSSLLRQKNVETGFVNSLTDAEKVLQQESPCVIFLDNHLPDGMGIDYIPNIRSVHPNSHIVMITAHDTSADRQKALNSGADQFIAKPFNREMIFKTLEKISA